MSLSVIIPAHQAAATLSRCLAGVARSIVPPAEVIVVDDGSRDETAAIARGAGATVVAVAAGPRGPAAARNAGAAVAQGDILVFLDSDVVIDPDVLGRFASLFAEHAEVVAVFGSYDDRPEHPALVSRYRNLLHHFTHQQARRDASTFWAGCGAVRRAAFLDIGGFDERYRRASIEDIELGARLKMKGHQIWLCRDIQATHLKRWTFTGAIRSDIVDRAVPWTRLIARAGRLPADLNTSWRNRAAAAVAWLVVLSTVTAVAWPSAAWVAAIGLAVLVALNARFYSLLWRKGQVPLALVGVAMHGLYLLYSSLVFLVLGGWVRLRRRESP